MRWASLFYLLLVTETEIGLVTEKHLKGTIEGEM
jgi:hypothetical protein